MIYISYPLIWFSSVCIRVCPFCSMQTHTLQGLNSCLYTLILLAVKFLEQFHFISHFTKTLIFLSHKLYQLLSLGLSIFLEAPAQSACFSWSNVNFHLKYKISLLSIQFLIMSLWTILEVFAFHQFLSWTSNLKVESNSEI